MYNRLPDFSSAPRQGSLSRYSLYLNLLGIDSSSQTASTGRFFCPRQVTRFLLFSGLAAAVNIGSGYLLYTLAGFKEGWRYGVSVGLAFLLGVGVSFLFNRRFTFASSGRRLEAELRTFFLVSIGGLLLTVTLSHLLRDVLLPWLLEASIPILITRADINLDLAGHVAAVGLVAFYSFVAHKLFSFGHGIGPIRELWRKRVDI